jgi:uncharacterized protein YkwD
MKIIFPLIFSSSLAFGQWQPVPPADPTPTPYPGFDTMQIAVNDMRELYKLPLLVSTIALNCAAEKHALDMHESRMCQHQGTDNSTFQTRARDCGTEAQAELIACGFLEAQMAVGRWMRDLRSRNIITSDDNVAIGSAKHGTTWVVVFRTMAK